jgi:methyltransferase-like protein 6
MLHGVSLFMRALHAQKRQTILCLPKVIRYASHISIWKVSAVLWKVSAVSHTARSVVRRWPRHAFQPLFSMSSHGLPSSTQTLTYFERDFDPSTVAAAGAARVAAQLAGAAGSVPTAAPARAWSAFHFRNRGHFFHPRRYLCAAFPALACPDTSALASLLARAGAAPLPAAAATARPLVILETGAGDGSNVAALRAANPLARLLVTDFTAASLKFIADALAHDAAPGAPELYLLDISQADDGGGAAAPAAAAERAGADWAALPAALSGGVDAALCTFTLSAVPPPLHARALRNICRTLRPGGALCFRDYAEFDAAQLRARPENVVAGGGGLHVRGDGTLAFYFSEAGVAALLAGAGLQVLELRTCTVRQRNRAKGTEMLRLYVHALAVKTAAPDEQ